MKVKARIDLFQNIGQPNEKKSFVRGKTYKYWAMDSSWQNHQVSQEPNCGGVAVFNEQDFSTFFELQP